jgi:galactonate dehydratase
VTITALETSLKVFLIQEQSCGIHYDQPSHLLRHQMDPALLTFTGGAAQRPTPIGLGVEIDEDAVRRTGETGHPWRNPVWSHRDSSFAEW